MPHSTVTAWDAVWTTQLEFGQSSPDHRQPTAVFTKIGPVRVSLGVSPCALEIFLRPSYTGDALIGEEFSFAHKLKITTQPVCSKSAVVPDARRVT